MENDPLASFASQTSLRLKRVFCFCLYPISLVRLSIFRPAKVILERLCNILTEETIRS